MTRLPAALQKAFAGKLSERQVSIRLPVLMEKRLRELALEFDLSLSTVVVQIISVALEDAEQ